MINRILMELYDDYSENNSIDNLIDFAKKTFPNDGTDKFFVGSVLIMFSMAGAYKPRYYCDREHLLSVVMLAKEKIGSGNLLEFYVERVNEARGISKYLRSLVKDVNIEKYADLIIDYLEQFKPNLILKIKGHRGLYEYIKTKKNNNID